MTAEDAMQATPEAIDSAMSTEPALADVELEAGPTKKRPRIDMAVEPRERKRGKTMFGLVLGTLTKAKNEDKERNASDAAKKRQLIEQRLQDKLRKETDSVRRADEAKKAKTTANRKEEELQLKDSIYKLRRIRLPLLSNFLMTSDVIPPADSDPPPSTNPLAAAPRTRPSPLYYLPVKLLPSQEVFLQRRKAEMTEAVEKEWETFKVEREAGIEEISGLRQRVAEEDSLRKASQPVDENDPRGDVDMAVGGEKTSELPSGKDVKMEVEEDKKEDGGVKKDEFKAGDKTTPTPGYDDDAVEY